MRAEERGPRRDSAAGFRGGIPRRDSAARMPRRSDGTGAVTGLEAKENGHE
jgi:hypothetical protein